MIYRPWSAGGHGTPRETCIRVPPYGRRKDQAGTRRVLLYRRQDMRGKRVHGGTPVLAMQRMRVHETIGCKGGLLCTSLVSLRHRKPPPPKCYKPLHGRLVWGGYLVVPVKSVPVQLACLTCGWRDPCDSPISKDIVVLE